MVLMVPIGKLNMHCTMPYVIHNCVYKLIDAVKGQQTQTHLCYKNTIQVIKKTASRKEKKKNYPGKLVKHKDYLAALMYISGDNTAQIKLANSHLHMAKGHSERRQAFMLFLVTVLWQKWN